MKAILGLFSMYLVFNLGLVAVGVGIGFLLHWLMPSVELGTSILIGVVATGFSIHYFLRTLSYIEYMEPPRSEDDDELPLVQVYPRSAPRSRRKRKQKEN